MPLEAVEQSKTKKVPKLRFPGFSDSWEEKKLGEVAEITTGQTPLTSNRDFYGGEFLFVSPADFNSQRYITKTKTTCTKAGFEKVRKVVKESVLFVCIGSTIGKIAQAGVTCITNQQINSINSNTSNLNDFIYFSLLGKAKKIKLLAGEQAVPIINKSEFSKIKINLPTFKEQQKIAGFLGAVDGWIENLKKQKENFESYKKGMMQKIFSQEIRFKDDDGKAFPKWEENKLGEVCNIELGRKKNISNGKYLEIGDIDINSKKYDISDKEKIAVSGAVFVPQNTLLVSKVRPGRGAIAITQSAVYVSSAFTRIKMNSKYLFYLLNQKVFFDFLNSITTGSTYPTCSDRDILNYEFLYTTDTKEQQKIADFLTSVDKIIESKQQQITQAEQWKRGLMQGLFV